MNDERPVKPEAARKKLDSLIARWPAVFTTPPSPLKVGIYADLFRALANPHDQFIDSFYWSYSTQGRQVSAALLLWTRSDEYLKACVEGAPRIGLDGNAAGVVTDDEAEFARKMLAGEMKPGVKRV